MKNFLKIILSIVICVVFLIGMCIGGFAIFYTPSLTADMSVKTGAVTTGASGYLYGLAEKGVPSENMTESIDISTVSQKMADGLQHPIGDISHVYSQLDNTDYIVVYLQDAYSTWYYEHDSIEKQRSEGKYDWKKFLENDYLPKVEKAVNDLSGVPYSDKIIYCIYNECDNGVWFGETKESSDSQYGVYGDYNAVGEKNFFDAWKITYDFVKSIHPNALIGGPGFCDYDKGEIRNFMTFCTENSCVPEVMIYHELNDSSIYHWQGHVEDYRGLEAELGIEELPIIVTEYGRMQDNGMPGRMLQYITQIETSKVYADNAYWRLANNLCDVAADDNCPNSNWWLYRWYTDMEGQTVDISYQDLFKSNLGKALKGEAGFSSKGFMGLVTMNDAEDKIEIICGGRDGSAVVKLKNLSDTGLFKPGYRLAIKTEEVIYKGISGVVNSPVVKSEYYIDAEDTIKIDMNDMDESSAYHITIVPIPENSGRVQEDYINSNFIERHEFEEGELLGGAYTYNSAYATTGEKDGMVGGMEKAGDGVALDFTVPEDGTYNLDIIYGNSNDGAYDEDGRQNPDDRADSTCVMSIDGKETVMSFANTIKSEYTDCITVSCELTKGEHTISFKHDKGTIVLDSLLVSTSAQSGELAVLDDADRTNDSNQSYLVVAPEDGCYDVYSDESPARINNVRVNFKNGHNTVYLMRGLNYIDVESNERSGIVVTELSESNKAIELDVRGAALSGGASIQSDKKISEINYIDGISCRGGRADFNVKADKSGTYALTILYANNDEGGKHDYNVDLIERYVTVTAGGKSQDVYCRNTYSWNTYKTVTCYVDLQKGNNTISLTNSGNNKFDNQDTYAPHIAHMSVNEIIAD